MRNYAIFRFGLTNPSLLMQALIPDISQEDYSRSSVEINSNDKDSLILTISAEDLHALRASLNTWLRLVGVADEIFEYTNQKSGANIL